MKKCPFCAEDIQDQAVKCKHCGEFILKYQAVPWYFKTHILVLAFLCVGPLMLPLVLFHPHYTKKAKVVASLSILLLSAILIWVMAFSVKSLEEYYQLLKSFSA